MECRKQNDDKLSDHHKPKEPDEILQKKNKEIYDLTV